ncbi:adenylyl-sulfate kinase [Lysobacter helvus]|uniref:Multifunctional fusion protein n=2 Tax=Lysobacteraceae TaxID=32033 RepID=A0ABN6FYG0_9GAMM|nr:MULTISPECIES: sulfate adenylyltransferase subunit CysN [Lysobacter]BCT92852.1 adenylyl-sulfate kinase [Lysobacter caseinilyticus]BCT96005.1 adenylyl-sulfate kinase [Lysobacter helvus]
MTRVYDDTDIAAALRRHEHKDLLRFITCGSVDDGKSTLIGRLLHDSKRLFEDQLAALAADSRRHGTQGENIDYALLLDGLAAEREQGITIDVAYRFFDTERRKFIVADCPGHEQYTRNMATGASTADLAVVLVDARKGLLPQTRRHTYIASLLGLRHVVLAVNKMDLVGYDFAVFETIANEYAALASSLGIPHVQCIPLSALQGDNLIERSQAMPWYDGPALLEYLDTVQVDRVEAEGGFRLPVQWVQRPDRRDADRDFRGYAGTLVAGRVAPGGAVVVLPAGRRSRVARVLGPEGARESAVAGQAIMLVLEDEIDVSRGDVIAAGDDAPEVSDQFAAHVLWMGEGQLLPGRPYWLKLGTRTVGATVSALKHKVDVDTQASLAATHLDLNEVGYVNLSLDQAIAFEPYAKNRALGGFILIDRIDNTTVAAGTLDFALRRAGNLHWQHIDVDRATRARSLGQAPRCVWFTGLSGSGKSTIANLVDRRLQAMGLHAFVLDGDNVRHGLNRDLGFTDEDRVENLRRVGEVARLMTDAGLIVLVSFISPFRAERRTARALFGEGEFLEVFVDTPMAVAEARDVKGLYAKARRGDLPNFTGIDSPYEAPEAAELVLDTTSAPAEELAERVVAMLLGRG